MCSCQFLSIIFPDYSCTLRAVSLCNPCTSSNWTFDCCLVSISVLWGLAFIVPMSRIQESWQMVCILCWSTLNLLKIITYRFAEYLDISPQLYPMNCLKAVSTEISRFKEQLCEIRSSLLEVIILIFSQNKL